MALNGVIFDCHVRSKHVLDKNVFDCQVKNSFKANDQRVFVVLGMHRSGTSAVTRALQTLGVNLGNHLMPAIEGNNDKGFWEDLDIYALNVDLLQALGHDWHTLSPISEHEIFKLSTLSQFKQRAQDLISQKLSEFKYFGLKDPRIPRLLVFWNMVFEQLNLKPGYIIAYRSPVSVAHSLARRNDFDFEKSYLLWYEHMLKSLALTAHHSRLVVNFDALMEDPARQLQRMAKAMGLDFDHESAEYLEYKSEFLDPSLRHTHFEPSDLQRDHAAPRTVKELNELLLRLSNDTNSFNSASIQSWIENAHDQLQGMQHCMPYMRKLEEKLVQMSSSVHFQHAQIMDLQALANKQEAIISAHESLVSEKDKELARLHQNYNKLDTEYQHLRQSLPARIMQGIQKLLH